MTVTLIWRTAY